MINRVLLALCSISLCFLAAVPLGHTAMFMFVDAIKGEVFDPPHKDWIELLGAQWGHGEPPPGATRAPQFERLTISKDHDSTSALFARHAADGKPFRELKLEITVPFGNVRKPVSRVKLTGVRVTSYSTAAAGSESIVPTDSIAFNFETITWINIRYNSSGDQISGNAACFDLRTNTSCPSSF